MIEITAISYFVFYVIGLVLIIVIHSLEIKMFRFLLFNGDIAL